MTEEELIQDIQDEITFSGMLPYSLPKKEISRLISIDERFFYDNWRYAVETRYLLLPFEIFKSSSFIKKREIILPDCIQFVTDAREAKGGSLFSSINSDFSDQKFIGSEILLTPFMGESLMYRTILFSFLDLTKSFVLESISYDYNKNTKTFIVIGRNPSTSVVLTVLKKIERNKLFEDELFQRYIRAHCKIRLTEMLNVFDFPLPGDVKINYQTLLQQAEKEMESIKNMMKSENTPDWMIIHKK